MRRVFHVSLAESPKAPVQIAYVYAVGALRE
jgi:hypothetical protein